jgi:hypothetical protein
LTVCLGKLSAPGWLIYAAMPTGLPRCLPCTLLTLGWHLVSYIGVGGLASSDAGRSAHRARAHQERAGSQRREKVRIAFTCSMFLLLFPQLLVCVCVRSEGIFRLSAGREQIAGLRAQVTHARPCCTPMTTLLWLIALGLVCPQCRWILATTTSNRPLVRIPLHLAAFSTRVARLSTSLDVVYLVQRTCRRAC